MEDIKLYPSLYEKLKTTINVNNAEELRKWDLPILCQDMELTRDEVDALYSAVHKDSLPRIYNGLELLQRGPKITFIPTFCETFNVLLSDSGIPVGKVVEFCGSPGTGKTQLGIQLAINALLSSTLTPVDTQALYVDTEGGFHIQRAYEIANSMAEQMQARHTTEQSELPSARDLLSNIHLFRIHTHFELLAFVISLPNILEAYPKIRIIVIDTITFHLRTNIRDLTTKGKIIKSILEHLHKLASSGQVAIVVMNQMTTFKDGSTIIPALGQRWGQQIHCRIQLSEDYKGRHAIRIKPGGKAIMQQPFSITSEGIRNADGDLDEILDKDTSNTFLINLSCDVADVDIGEISIVSGTTIPHDDEGRSILFTDDILQEATQTYAGHKRQFDAIDDDDERDFTDADVLCFASQDYY